MMKNETHVCEGCGREEKLPTGKRHWCKVCNPNAPHYMTPKRWAKDLAWIGGAMKAMVGK